MTGRRRKQVEKMNSTVGEGCPTPGKTGWTRRADARRALKSLGSRLDPERPLQLATEAAIARQSLPVDFPEAVEREAARVVRLAAAWDRGAFAARAARRQSKIFREAA